MITLHPTDELIVVVASGTVDACAFFADSTQGSAIATPNNAIGAALTIGTHTLVPAVTGAARRLVREVRLVSAALDTAATAKVQLRRTVGATITTINLTGVKTVTSSEFVL